MMRLNENNKYVDLPKLFTPLMVLQSKSYQRNKVYLKRVRMVQTLDHNFNALTAEPESPLPFTVVRLVLYLVPMQDLPNPFWNGCSKRIRSHPAATDVCFEMDPMSTSKLHDSKVCKK